MIRPVAVATAVMLGGAVFRPEPWAGGTGPATMVGAAADARNAWSHRDFSAFVAASAGNRILVSLPNVPASAPLPPDQAAALLRAYVQGTEEVNISVEAATEVDSTRGFVQLSRRYRLVGMSPERQAVILLAYRRGREAWVLAEVRIAP